MKKVLSVLLALVMVLTLMPMGVISASAASSGTTGNCTWSLDGTVLTISGNGKMGNYDDLYDNPAPWGKSITSVIIGDGVTSIGTEAFYNCTSLTSVSLPNNVTSIGEGAFRGCDRLTSITIPNSVTVIGGYAFSSCENLTSITIPSSVTSIGESAFCNCFKLGSINVATDNTTYCSVDGVLFNIDKSLLIWYPEDKTATHYTIPNSVTSIGKSAFWGCNRLTSVTIPDSVTSIGEKAFYSCKKLTSVTIPNSVTTMGNSVFLYCTDLTSVTIEKGVTEIASSAFSQCTKLATVAIPDSVTVIGGYAFSNCTSLASVTIPDSVTTIGRQVFYKCTRLTSVTIPNGVTVIDSHTFNGCSRLSSVIIPDSVISIGYGAFDDCDSLTIRGKAGSYAETYANENGIPFEALEETLAADFTYTIANGKATITGYKGNGGDVVIPSTIKGCPVTAIGSYAFADRTDLTSVTIPDSITEIGDSAFSYCSSLTSVTIGNGVTSIGDEAFYDCDSLTAITVASGNSAYSSADGVLFDKGKTTLMQYPAGKTATSYTIPDSVTSIGESAFSDCTSLTSVTIPNSVTTIGNWAFAYTGLTSIHIPASVTFMYDAFGNIVGGCNNLTSITVAENNSKYIAINNCLINKGNKYVVAGCKNSVIPNDGSVVGITMYAFNNLSALTSLTIPASVTDFDARTIYGCSGLKSIEVADGNTTYCSIDGVLFNKNKTSLLAYPAGKTDSAYIVPSSVTEIGYYSFCGCNNLTSVTIPDSVTEIDPWSFDGCTGLEAIDVTNNHTAFCSVDGILFNKNKTELLIYPAGKTATSYIIPDSVISIGYRAFSNCYSLTSVTIPDSVTAIAYSAFDDCDNLTIHGEAGSYAETYANRNGIPFVNVLESIAVTTMPHKLNYLEGENLDLTGGKVMLTYMGGVTETVALTECQVIGYNANWVGTQTLTVTYGGKTTTYTVTINAKSLSSIAVTTKPTKLTYLEAKDTLNVTGGKVTLYYNNDTSKVIDMTASMVSGFDNTKVGTQTLTVTYGGKTTTFTVTINAKSLSGIELMTDPDVLTYLEGKDELDVTGAKVWLYYNNGTSELVNLTTAMVSGFDNTKVGKQTLTVTYGGQTTTYKVEIIAKSLTGITLTTKPSKLTYLEAKDPLDTTGGKLTLIYDNDTTEVIDLTADMVSGFDNTTVGVQTLTVAYGGKTTTYTVTINAKSLSSIAVTTKPTKLTYLEAKDTLNVTGGKVTLYYNNDTSKGIDMTASMVSGFDNTKVGTQTLTVTYGGKTTTYTVTINAKSLSSIAVTTKPTKLTYLEAKDTLNVTGGKVTLYYNNDTSKVIDMTASMVSGFDNTKVGTQTLTVTYGGKTTTYTVTINAKSLSSIAVTTKPTKLTYLEAKDTLNVTGGKVTLYYNNDTSKVVDLTADMVSGFDNTKVGKKTLTVTYSDKTTTFEVEIIAKSLSGIAVTTLPNKLTYLEAKDKLDVSGGILTLTYNNGTSEDINLTTDMVSGFANTMVGEQTLMVIYGGFATSFKVEVIAKSLSRIEVSTKPIKLTYLEAKDTLDVSYGWVTLHYNNDTADVIPMTANMVSGFDNTKVGKQTLTVTYGGKTTTYEVEIIAKTLTGIELTTLPDKLTYLEVKDKLDVIGGKLTLYYNNDTTAVIDLTADMVSGFDNTKIGTQTLTVTYGDKTDTFEVEIIAKTLTSISVTTKPSKLTYLEVKDTLDVTDGEVTLYYDNDTRDVIELTSNMVSGFDNTKVGKQTLTVTYGGKNTTYEVEIIAKTLIGIELTAKPNRLTYLEVKDGLDVVGGKVTLSYNNDTTKVIDLTTDMVSGFDNTKVGKQTLTVTYSGKVDTYEVEIIAKSVSAIGMMTLPTTTAFLEAKDGLDVAGGQVVVYYNNDTSDVVDLAADMVSGFDNTKVGKQTLTVTYEGKTTTYEVEIIAKSLTGIAVTTLPNKLTYLEVKDALSVTGGKVTLSYNNDTAEVVDLTSAMVSGFDNTKVGKQTLTVTYGGKSTTYEVEVIAKTLTGIELTSKPNKLTYLEAKDRLDVTGGNVTLYYDNDTTKVIDLTTDMVSGFDNTKVGVQSLSVTYSTETTTFDVEIIAKSLVDIYVTTHPAKYTYLECKDTLSVTGGKLLLTYNNDTTAVIDMTTDMVSGFDNTQVGAQTLTVTYDDQTTTFEVEIIAKTLTGIAVSKLPDKTTYVEGKDALDTTGGKLTLSYNNDTTEVIDLTADMVSGFNNKLAGKQRLVVVYNSYTTFEVEVIHDYAAATCGKPQTCRACGATTGFATGKHNYEAATCTAAKTCKVCGNTDGKALGHTHDNACDTTCNRCKVTRKITHSYKTTTNAATLSKNGSIVEKCTVCGKVASTTTIKYAKTFKLAATTYTYNGKAKKPTVTVKDSAGKTLKKGTDYTVSYAKGCKNVGTYKVTIKLKGKYSGTKTLTFKINPPKTTVKSLTVGKKSLTVAITKKSTQVSGYQVQYSTSKKFTGAKTKTISSYKTTKCTLKSLGAKKTYYVRVRTYKTVNGKKYYSGWSTVKYKKTK